MTVFSLFPCDLSMWLQRGSILAIPFVCVFRVLLVICCFVLCSCGYTRYAK